MNKVGFMEDESQDALSSTIEKSPLRLYTIRLMIE